MKKYIFISIFMLLFLVTFVSAQTAQAPAWVADVVPVCNGVCLEGNVAAWNVQIQNVGQISFNLQQIVITDSDGIVFARNDMTEQQATIQPGQSGTVAVQGIVPPPSRASTLFYKLNYVVANQAFPDSSFRRMTVLPISDVECTSNEFCTADEVCAAYRCAPRALFNQSELPKKPIKFGTDGVIIILLSVLVVLFALTLFMHNSKKGRRR